MTLKQQAVDTVSCTESPLILNASSGGSVTIWDTSLSLSQLCSFNLFTPITTEGKLKKAALVRCEDWYNAAQNEQQIEGENKKWFQWAATKIYVEVTDQGLYPGARGIILHLFSEDNIEVLVSGLEEKMSFPLKHLKALHPKLHHKARVVTGNVA